uniref:Uncharacterized protein n=1 Tax=Rhizophora mucronata TaxID=61149 RepID=A0A2P2JCC0_RHIMU
MHMNTSMCFFHHGKQAFSPFRISQQLRETKINQPKNFYQSSKYP